MIVNDAPHQSRTSGRKCLLTDKSYLQVRTGQQECEFTESIGLGLLTGRKPENTRTRAKLPFRPGCKRSDTV